MANSIISEYRVTFEPLSREATRLLSEACGIDFSGANFATDHWLCCTVYRRKDIAAIIVFEFKTDFDAHVTTAVWDPRALSRKLLTSVLRTVFGYVKRITALIDPENTRALQQVWRFGFKHEGYMRRGIDGKRDAVMFGLLPEDCPYLYGEPFRMRVVQPTHDQPIGVQ